MSALKKSTVVVDQLERAETFFSRLVGLLGRSELDRDSGLFIAPCSQIHTFFMKFPIDVVFLDKYNIILKIYSKMPPWRMTSLVWSAQSVLELTAGKAGSIEVGDRLEISGNKVFVSNN